MVRAGVTAGASDAGIVRQLFTFAVAALGNPSSARVSGAPFVLVHNYSGLNLVVDQIRHVLLYRRIHMLRRYLARQPFDLIR